MLLRESNYFDCRRDQLRVDLIDEERWWEGNGKRATIEKTHCALNVSITAKQGWLGLGCSDAIGWDGAGSEFQSSSA
jgi:hypothetical protein